MWNCHCVTLQCWCHPFPSVFSIFLCPSFPHSFCCIQVVLITIWCVRRISSVLDLKIPLPHSVSDSFSDMALMRVPFPNCSHSLLIISSGFVTQKFSVLGWFWSRFWFRFLYFFLDFLLPLDIIFFFLPLPKLHFIFLFSSVVLFSLFKTNFAIFAIGVDTLLIFTNSTEV